MLAVIDFASTRPVASARGTISGADGTDHASSQVQAVESGARSPKPDRRTSRTAFEPDIATTISRSFRTGRCHRAGRGVRCQAGLAFTHGKHVKDEIARVNSRWRG